MSARENQVGGSHYSSMKVQPWDALDAWMTPEELRGYHKGVVIAYLAREKQKGGDQDIRKAAHHLQKLVELLDKQDGGQVNQQHQATIFGKNDLCDKIKESVTTGLLPGYRVSQHEINESKKRD